MSEPTIDALLARIEALEREARRSPGAPRRRLRLAVMALAIVGLMAVPVGVFASHAFSDVPTSHKFHTAIGRVAGAGITSGCGGSRYCPSDTVNRGSMAAFLARAAGRATSGPIDGTIPYEEPCCTETTLGSVEIKAGDVTGGTANVKLDVSLIGTTEGVDGCPCAANLWLTDELGELTYAQTFVHLETPTLGGDPIDSASMTAVVPVETGVTTQFDVHGAVVNGTEHVFANGTITAAYFPFDGDGTNAPAVP
jgi:hypothetical protein